MPKVMLDKNAFKALASDTRLDILRTLDGKKMGLKDLSNASNLNKATLHKHLTKLYEAGLVKRKERKGHKLVYYKLSWKGDCLLHPDNDRIVVMSSVTLITLFFGIIGLFNFISSKLETSGGSDMVFKNVPETEDTINQAGGEILGISQNQLFLYITIVCFILFSILFIISISKYKKNMIQRL